MWVQGCDTSNEISGPWPRRAMIRSTTIARVEDGTCSLTLALGLTDRTTPRCIRGRRTGTPPYVISPTSRPPTSLLEPLTERDRISRVQETSKTHLPPLKLQLRRPRFNRIRTLLPPVAPPPLPISCISPPLARTTNLVY
jgi:hypothetical protein